jgi:hypothetical protein
MFRAFCVLFFLLMGTFLIGFFDVSPVLGFSILLPLYWVGMFSCVVDRLVCPDCGKVVWKFRFGSPQPGSQPSTITHCACCGAAYDKDSSEDTDVSTSEVEET